MDYQYGQLVYDVIKTNIIPISTNKNGCCVIQKLIDNSQDEFKELLIDSIIECSLGLILDQFGNYVIQYILAFKDYNYNERIILGYLNDISYLSKQKYSSNVIEKVSYIYWLVGY